MRASLKAAGLLQSGNVLTLLENIFTKDFKSHTESTIDATIQISFTWDTSNGSKLGLDKDYLNWTNIHYVGIELETVIIKHQQKSAPTDVYKV